VAVAVVGAVAVAFERRLVSGRRRAEVVEETAAAPFKGVSSVGMLP
jgi:hypothetical protein